MVESRLHIFLKAVGEAWLVNQGCFLTGQEAPLNKIGLDMYHESDNRFVIDVLGIGLRYGVDEELEGPYEAGRIVSRGIEVKVSASDFRSGYASSGCNYHYLLAPIRLIAPTDLPKGVGLLTYNKHKFHVEETHDPKRPYKLEGVRLLKPAIYRQIPRFHVDHTIAQLAEKALEGSASKELFLKLQVVSR